MKFIGIIFISLGLALLCFVGYSYFRDSNRTVSPIPQPQGVKVIFVTPTP